MGILDRAGIFDIASHLLRYGGTGMDTDRVEDLNHVELD